MQTIRRLYLYAAALVGFLTALWSLINLTRGLFDPNTVASASQLASALAFILVAAPVFGLHWFFAQRAALQDGDERSARVRALFFYTILMSLLVPAVQNLLALVSRLFLAGFNLPVTHAIIGGNQTTTDNLIALLFNGAAALYFWRTLQADWRAAPQGNAYLDVRRLYRLLWTWYGLGLTLSGLQGVLEYLTSTWGALGPGFGNLLGNGIAFTLVGVPVWQIAWRAQQSNAQEESEQQSILRLIGLFVPLGTAALATLIATLSILQWLFKRALASALVSPDWSVESLRLLGGLIPLAIFWVYFAVLIRREQPSAPREGLSRLYRYGLALLGLGVTLISLNLIGRFVLETLLSDALQSNTGLAEALGVLVVGLPVWLAFFIPLNQAARQQNAQGERARASLVRRGYLYFALFAGVMGLMISAGSLLFQGLSALLGATQSGSLLQSADAAKMLILFGGLLGYHLWVLRADAQQTAVVLAEKQAAFPILVIANRDATWLVALLEALQRAAPGVPVATHWSEDGAPVGEIAAARAVLLPVGLATRPSEALRVWLNNFNGTRLLLPLEDEHWFTVGSRAANQRALFQQAARLIADLAEGEPLLAKREFTAWSIVGYVLAVLVAIPLLISLAAALIQALGQ
ncbi:MAG: hypothetical protein OHK0052_18940 [Anaerolineales bacterium]